MKTWKAVLMIAAASLASSVLGAEATPPAPGLSLMVAPIVSLQPPAFRDSIAPRGGTYLDHGLRGYPPGLLLAVGGRTAAGWTAALELSSTKRLQTGQDGVYLSGPVCFGLAPGYARFAGCGDGVSRGRDTMLALLVGNRGRVVSLKAGLAGVDTRVEQSSQREAERAPALVGGLDVVRGLGRHNAIVALVRYAHVFRGADMKLQTGIGSDIFRIGLGFRIAAVRHEKGSRDRAWSREPDPQ